MNVETHQDEQIRAGDSFALLDSSSSEVGELVAAALTHKGLIAATVPANWYVEFSFSERPVTIELKGGETNAPQPIGLDAPGYLLDCNRQTQMVRVRILSAKTGAEAFSGGAEQQACGQTADEAAALLVGQALNGLSVE